MCNATTTTTDDYRSVVFAPIFLWRIAFVRLALSVPENSHFDLLDLLVYMKQYECKYSIVLGIYSWF